LRKICFIASVLGAAAAGLGVVAGAQAQDKPGADLTGFYFAQHPVTSLKPVDGRPVPLTEAGRAAYAANAPKVAATKVNPAGMDMAACIPFGPTRLLEQPYPLNIQQKGKMVLLNWEHNHVWELVYLGEKDNPDADPSYAGYSVGHWEGSTLVVDTTHFNDATFLDDTGLPHSDDLKVERRIRKLAGGKGLQIQATVTDPAMYSRPWTVSVTLPETKGEIEEYVCGLKTMENRYTRARDPMVIGAAPSPIILPH
jgi:hypothetical protein